MEIKLIRRRLHEDSIDGQLLIYDMPVCDTTENRHHCLPRGLYDIHLVYCHRSSRKLPLLQVTAPDTPTKPDCPHCPSRWNRDSPPPPCPRIRTGNGAANLTDGSILVGQSYLPGVILQSDPTFQRLYTRIAKTVARGKDVKLRVVGIH